MEDSALPSERQPGIDLETQSVLLAASQHDVQKLRSLLRNPLNLANVQDAETGFTPLHAAIAACEPEDSSETVNQEPQEQQRLANGNMNGSQSCGDVANGGSVESDIPGSVETVKLLLQNGAIWNDLDTNNETPGCMARRLGLKKLYAIMVDAGTRAEMLLNRLDEYEQLQGDGEDENEGADDDQQPLETDQQGHTDVSGQTALADGNADPVSAQDEGPEVDSEVYLRSDLSFAADRLLDQDKNGVMMAWETDIMQKTADLLAPTEGLRILNIGHGMGIIDGIFQSKGPSSHHIIEAHPAVLEHMNRDGWKDKPHVTLHAGKWQDVVPKLIEDGVQFDAIFYDTFAEDYKALKSLFEDHIIGLLDDAGKWSFFNGLGADRQICADVYKNVVSMDIAEAGYEISWTAVEVPNLVHLGTWQGVRRPYWKLDEYHLPICSFFG